MSVFGHIVLQMCRRSHCAGAASGHGWGLLWTCWWRPRCWRRLVPGLFFKHKPPLQRRRVETVARWRGIVDGGRVRCLTSRCDWPCRLDRWCNRPYWRDWSRRCGQLRRTFGRDGCRRGVSRSWRRLDWFASKIGQFRIGYRWRWRGAAERDVLPEIFPVPQCDPAGPINTDSILIMLEHLNNCARFSPMSWMISNLVLDKNLVPDLQWR